MSKPELEWTPAMRAVDNAISDMTEMGNIDLAAIREVLVAKWIVDAVRPVILREAAAIIEDDALNCCGGAHADGLEMAAAELRIRADVAEGVHDGQA